MWAAGANTNLNIAQTGIKLLSLSAKEPHLLTAGEQINP